MAILRRTEVNGDLIVKQNLNVNQNLTVDGNLNVQGELTYVGVKDLRVKDKQIELNTDDSGSSVVGTADKAGIVIRGARKSESVNVNDDASILYDNSDDTLVVNKTIKGTVSKATTADSADKVANTLTVNVTDKTGTVKTVFDGSEAKTVDVNLKDLQDQINSLSGGVGSIATQISNAINDLNSTVTAEATGNATKDGVFVLKSVEIVEGAGKLTSATPTAIEVEKAGAAAAVKTALIGEDTDTADSATIKGAKKYADSLASNYAEASHKHEIGEVNGLQAALDEKAAKSHTHATSEITGLDTALAGKQGKLSANQLAAVNSGITAEKVSALESASHTHKNKAELDKIADGDVAKWNAAEQNAKNYTNIEIGKLGTAAHRDVLTGTIASSSSDDLVTAAQVKAYAAGVVGAMHFRGAFAENTVISSVISDPASGDVCLVGTKEYVYNGSEWVLFGDEGAYDTKGSADTALENAKKYADGLNTAMGKRVDTLEGKSHTHANQEELNKIATGDKAKWDGHVADADIHVTAEQKTTWSAKQDALANAATLAAITPIQVSNWDKAFEKAHEHANKKVLDGITADKVAAWDGAVSAAGVSSVGGKAGALTLKGDSATLGDVNLSISDGGEISAAIVPNSFDSFGAAATAEQNAKTYADGKVADLKKSVDTLSNDVLKGVAAGNYVSVSAKSGNSQTISVTTEDVASASDTPKGLALAADVKKYVDGKNTEIENNYVKKAGDTMTGNLTMPSNGTNGIIFGNMKIVWNVKDSAIEFIPTTA